MKVSTSNNTTAVNIGITEDNRHQIAKRLEVLLSDEHILYIKTRNYHWNVKGMYFQPLHELFGEQYVMIEAEIDEIAERIRQLGFFSPGSMEAFRELSRLKETDHLNGDAEAMLQNLLIDHEMIIKVLRHDIEAAENGGDAGTADYLTALMEKHEKVAWMLRAHVG